MATLTNEEYEARRRFLDELKSLSKLQHQRMFELVKQQGIEYSENSNGVFFDISKLSKEAFTALQTYIEYCRTVQEEEVAREEEERKAQNWLR